MAYSTIFFDLYGTLIDIETDEWADAPWIALRDVLDVAGAHYATLDELKGTFHAKEAELDQEMSGKPNHEIDLTPVYARLYTARGLHPTYAQLTYAAWTFRRASTKRLRLYEGATDLLDALKAQGRRVVLLSNAQELYTLPELTQLGLDEHLDDVFISSMVGWKKPSPEFYRLALVTTGSKPATTLMVGNDPGADIAGAHRMRMDAVYLYTSSWFGSVAPDATANLHGADYTGLLSFIEDRD